MNSKKNDSEKLVKLVIKCIAEKKGEQALLIDIKKVSSIADYFIVVTGTSSVHVRALSDEIHEKLKQEMGVTPWHIEGYEAEKWILLDYIDIVVHIFDNATRQYYSLEKIWEDAEIKHIKSE